jgi:hypothetical protein
MPFQTAVNAVPAPGIAGDFASTNPRATVLGGPGGLVAGAAGVACGAFGWVDTATFTTVSNTGAGAPNGFVRNAHNALITAYLGETSLVIPAGFMVGDLFDAGDFWVKNSGTTEAVPGMKAFANNATGVASFAAAGTIPTGGSCTGSIAAVSTTSVTGSIAVAAVGSGIGPGTNPGVLAVTVVGSGTVYPGLTLSGSNVVTGTQVVAQLLPLLAGEAAGGVGRYTVNIPQTVASTTITMAGGILTVASAVTGSFAVGDSLNGTGGGGVTSGTVITGIITGSGGVGTYVVSPTQSVTSSTINAQGATETGWYCRSFGAAGEAVKISSRAMG